MSDEEPSVSNERTCLILNLDLLVNLLSDLDGLSKLFSMLCLHFEAELAPKYGWGVRC